MTDKYRQLRVWLGWQNISHLAKASGISRFGLMKLRDGVSGEPARRTLAKLKAVGAPLPPSAQEPEKVRARRKG